MRKEFVRARYTCSAETEEPGTGGKEPAEAVWYDTDEEDTRGG